jgi:DNA-binding response OmpR family regulator
LSHYDLLVPIGGRRALPDALIIALTARTAELDVIMTLDAGADDYLTKPFRLGELLARLRAHLRNRPAGSVGELRVGTLFMDLLARTVQIRDESLHLRPKQFDLLAVLAGRAGAVVTREHLMSEVWDEHWSGRTKTLDVHVSALRRKLGEVNSTGQIVTSRGRGYRYEAGE